MHTSNEIWYGGGKGDADTGVPCLYEEFFSDKVSFAENKYCANKFLRCSIDDHSAYRIVAMIGKFCQ